MTPLVETPDATASSFALGLSEPAGVRRHLDQYYTPEPVADALVRAYLEHYPPARSVLEPHVGRGAWTLAVRRHMGDAFIRGVDIEPRGIAEPHYCNQFEAVDFLNYRPPAPDLIIGNPPYNNAEAHVRHALDIVRNGGRVAFLLRLAFCESRKRIEFWRDNPASTVHVLAERPSFTGGKTDNAAYGFFVWEKGALNPTRCFPGFSWAGPK